MIKRCAVQAAAGAAVLLNSVAAYAEGCNFPSSFPRREAAEYEQPPPGPPGRIAANIRIVRLPPKLIRPQIDTTLFITPSEDDEDLVNGRAEIIVDGALFQQQLNSSFTASSFWNSTVTDLRSCENRIGSPDIVMTGYSERNIELRLDVVVERHACGPGGSGFKIAGGHVVGPIHLFQARIPDAAEDDLQFNIFGLEATAGPFSVTASQEQDHFFNILQATPLGVQLAAGGLHYDNLKGKFSNTINALVTGQHYPVTKEFYNLLGSELAYAAQHQRFFQLGSNKEIPPMQLYDVQFVRGPNGGFAIKLSFAFLGELRRSETCALLRRHFNI